MKVLITSRAKKQIERLPSVVRIAVVEKIRALAEGGDNLQIKKLKDRKDMYRVRVGRYRVVYEKTIETISIVVVQHRKDVYREL